MADKKSTDLNQGLFKSNAMAAVHASASALLDVGAIDQVTMRKFDRLTFKPVATLSPERIQAIRAANNVSQAVFADILNISLSSVQKWETGAKSPSGAALRLLDIVDRKGVGVLVG